MESADSSLLVFLAFLSLFFVVQVEAQSRVEEVRALLDFNSMLSLSTSSLGYLFSWNEVDENACAWIGITCTANFTVAALDLSGWGLNSLGNLSALSQLPDLLHLDLSSNALPGSIPDDIGSLTQVTWLDLSLNQFSGPIPPSISACRSLRYLSLEKNTYLDGPIPDLSELVQLQYLYLAGNRLSGSFPKQLGGMSRLVTVDLSRNSLSGLIPSLLNSTDLVSLKLDDNSFAGFEEPLHLNAPNLQQWLVSGNQLEGTIPLAMANLPGLRILDMSSNRLSGEIPSGFPLQTAQIYSFDFSQNQLSGSIPVSFLETPRENYLVSVNVSHNLLNGSLPTPTGMIPGNIFMTLDLSHNQLKGPVPSPVLKIYHLDLGNNSLSGDIVDALLDAGGHSLFSGAFSHELLLGNNLFTGDLTRMTYNWVNWTLLTLLDLSNNNLSWKTTEAFPDPLSAALENFPLNLLGFQVGGNNFSGTSLPVSLRRSAVLQTLDLSNNHLKGTISGAVFNTALLPYLTFLNLSHNEATGPVPENIITLMESNPGGQKVLDLSNNKLSGVLPFISLNTTFTNPSAFTGNDGLCGYPLTQCPQHAKREELWIILFTIVQAVQLAMSCCFTVAVHWLKYQERRGQDADLIKTLMEKDSATLMPLRDLKKATNNFCESARIGEGGFGTVYVGKLNNGTKVAIKKSKREGCEGDKQQFLNEVRILSQVSHRHLVKLLGCCMESKVSLLIFEFISNGTLQQHLQRKIGDVSLTWKQRLNVALQTADALNYLHCGTNFPIYHRDVKSANILLNDDLTTKVADFGISKVAPMQATHISTAGVGTIGYIDPEYYTYRRLTDKSDVYSFGVVLLELISAKPAIFSIDGEPVNLGIFAIPHIESGDMQPLMDPTLLETYNDTGGYGKESILNVGRLAAECLSMSSKGRPSMTEVWKELQNLCVQLNDIFISDDVGSMNEDEHENPNWDCQVFLPPIFSDENYSLGTQHDVRSLELSSSKLDLGSGKGHCIE